MNNPPSISKMTISAPRKVSVNPLFSKRRGPRKEYIVETTPNITEITNRQIETLQQDLATMYNNYGNAITSSQSILVQQQKNVGNIVSQEQTRINSEKNNLQQLLQTNIRTNDLKENARKRQNAYNYILFVAIVVLLICVILSFIQKTIPIIPEALISFLIVIIITAGILYISYLYYGISTRDMLNFDELHFDYKPVSKNNIDIAQASEKAKSSGDLLGTLFNPNYCFAADCCSGNTVFDKGIGKCVIPCSVGSVDLQGNCILASNCTGNNKVCGNSCIPNTQNCLVEGFLGLNLNLNQNIEPFSPSEFADYHKYSK